MADVHDIVQRASLRRSHISREEIRALARAYCDVAADLKRETIRAVEACALAATTIADAETLKLEVERLRELVTQLQTALGDSTTSVADARAEVERSKTIVDGHLEWRSRAMRVVSAAHEWSRNQASDRARNGLKDAIRSYGAEA